MPDPSIWSPENSNTVVRQVIEAMKGTSVTSTSIVSGNITFQTQPDKFFNIGSWLLIVYNPNTLNWMTGQVVSYDAVTGSLVFFSQFGQFTTTSPLADWTITVSGSQAPATFNGGVVAGATTFSNTVGFNGVVTFNENASFAAGKTLTLSADPVAPLEVATKQYVDSGAGIPVGSIMAFSRSVVLTGWLVCNGQAASRTTYAALFAFIGTVYGAGDGVTTFNMPNLSRRVIVGSEGTGTVVLGNNVSAIGGGETHTLIVPEIPTHNHNIKTVADGTGGGGGTGRFVASGGIEQDSTEFRGGSAAHNNIQPSMVLSYRIKT